MSPSGRGARAPTGLAACFGVPLLLGCSEAGTTHTTFACEAPPIVGGVPADQLFSLDAAQQSAILAILIPSASSGGGTDLCSGVAVAPTFALTAAHCFDRDRDGSLDHAASDGIPDASVVVRELAEFEAPRFPIDAAWLHPGLDVALFEARGLITLDPALEPLLPHGEALDDSWLSSPVEIAGYGITEDGEAGSLAFAIEEVTRLEPDFLVVDGRGRSGACGGDSGGPVLGRSNQGDARVVGVLDDGDPSCTGEDYFTRVDRLLDWQPFRENVLSATDGGPYGCEGLTAKGTCLRGRSFSCVDGQVAVDDCGSAGLVCGWNGSLGGFRCVAVDEDDCEGLGSFAHCESDAVIRCVGGLPRKTACSGCGKSCRPWVDGDGAACR